MRHARILFLPLLMSLCLLACGSSRESTLTGTVVDDTGAPIKDAQVRIKATDIKTRSDENGRFRLRGDFSDEPVFITAWAKGFYINGVDQVTSGEPDLQVVLQRHTDQDNPDYTWLPATDHNGDIATKGCSECHSRQGSPLDYALPVDEWLLDAHSQSAINKRFLTMYTGSDVAGNQSPTTEFAHNRDYGYFPLPPDLSKPYYGPGYKLDFPQTAGNCAACHAPMAAIDTPYSVDPSLVTGVESEGVSCDFCHKVWAVQLDPTTRLPYPNTPGVLSFEFRRPPEDHQFFAGPLDDVAPGEDTYSAIQKTSQFCAACHYGVFWDTVIYNSYGEWLASPYSNPVSGKTCQDCHMPALKGPYFVRPDKGGVARDPLSLVSHQMRGASDADLLQHAVTLKATAQYDGTRLGVTVSITNDLTGHHVPTDSPLRQMILVIDARDLKGEALPQLEGPVIPDWGGLGDPEEGYFAGLPGRGYAKILMTCGPKSHPPVLTGIQPESLATIDCRLLAMIPPPTFSARHRMDLRK